MPLTPERRVGTDAGEGQASNREQVHSPQGKKSSGMQGEGTFGSEVQSDSRLKKPNVPEGRGVRDNLKGSQETNRSQNCSEKTMRAPWAQGAKPRTKNGDKWTGKNWMKTGGPGGGQNRPRPDTIGKRRQNRREEVINSRTCKRGKKSRRGDFWGGGEGTLIRLRMGQGTNRTNTVRGKKTNKKKGKRRFS